MLVLRFLLDLQRANGKTLQLDSDVDSDRGGGRGLVFERVVGSIASSIEPGVYDDHLESADGDEDDKGGDHGDGGEGRGGHQGEESASGSVSGSGADQPEGDGEMQFVVPATPPPLSQVR